ncbi:YopJ/AvrA family T3SS effector serine/threonine acetyltransferase [Bartonella sp. cb54]|uniref:YopJ/AvrA family T3SS effector serine/threonine acetyltransferase n=1 Tax=Bartonella sp. cb54 TaxID=3385560 RepID=UPI0039A60822
MKPHDSQAAPPASSQPQEEHAANELSDLLDALHMEGAYANSEQDISSEEETVFSPERLQDIITNLEKDITDGSWLHAYYVDTDIKMMPILVEKANNKYSEMNLKLADSSENLALLMKKTIEDGTQSARFITFMKDRGTHFAVIDYRALNEQHSFVLLEPTTFNGPQQTGLAIRTLTAVKSHELPNCYFSMAEMDIQRSTSECGIFCLALAKKLHTESDRLQKMHEDNVKGVLCEPDTPLPSHKLDQYLPVTLYKHTQGRGRLNEYIKSNPSAINEKVNKKGETIFERFNKSLVTVGEGERKRDASVSSHKKRVREYKSALTL